MNLTASLKNPGQNRLVWIDSMDTGFNFYLVEKDKIV